jgi:predicted glycosyltransferase
MTQHLKIFVYCQHVWGVGHFFRIREIIRALAPHDVVLVTGGPEVEIPLPPHVRRFQLPVLRMQEDKQLVSADGRPAEALWPERIARLNALFRREAPHAFLVELYPMGRKAFRRELDPILADLRSGRLPTCRVFCSVRDILVEKTDPGAYETRVCRALNNGFDALLIHADPRVVVLEDTFGAVADIKIPVVYTGYVARPGPDRTARQVVRQKLGIPADETLIVVSAGGGRSGYPLLSGMLAVHKELQAQSPLRMVVFTGPYLAEAKQAELQAAAGPGVAVQQFSPDFTHWLAAADLSVSMAGYNTCMNLLTAGIPALVWPYEGDREQPLRAERLSRAGWLSVLRTSDLVPSRLGPRIAAALRSPSIPSAGVDLQGAGNTARYIVDTSRVDALDTVSPPRPQDE